MPRKARIDAVGALHHIIVRGIEQQAIFRDDHDRHMFLERLGRVLEETSTPCYAWAMMTNHIHLLLVTGEILIATVMRRLLTGYAQDFNRRHGRHGQVFQNRYKSILCEQAPYLLALVRYIHLNPLRADIVQDLVELGRYPYSGHAVLLGKRRCPWQEVDSVLAQFGDKPTQARKAYLDFVSAGSPRGRQPELIGGGLVRSTGGWREIKARRSQDARIKGDERILGGSEFVVRALDKADEALSARIRLQQQGLTMETLLNRVATYYGINAADMRSRTKQRGITQARAVFCYLAVRRLEASCVETAKVLRLTPPAVSKALVRGAELIKDTNLEAELLKC